MKVISQSNRESTEHNYAQIALLCFYAVMVGAYFALRFGGYWMEVDTARLTRAARAVLNEATITPSYPYQHGFTYPVVVAAIAQVSGVSVIQLQTLFLPMIGILAPALIAFAFFRAVLGSSALLAVLLLCLQSDFLFVTLRGSHEKLTWSLTMLALLILYRSAAKRHSFNQFAIHIILFYIILFAEITINFFFTSTFITAIILSLVIGIILNRWQNHPHNKTSHHFLTRLAMISISSLILVYFFLFHLYPPAEQILNLLPKIRDKIVTFLLGFEPQANPYDYIGRSWINLGIYFSVSFFTWLLLFASLAEWFRQGYYLLRGKETLRLPQSLPWLLYAGFAIQVALAIVMDFAGVLSANLQIRILPALILFAVVLATQGLQHLLRSIRWTLTRRKLLLAGLTLLLMWFVPASLVKITNDPIFSNKWFFYNAPEKLGFEWSDAHTRHQKKQMWVGLDERLLMLFFAESSTTEDLYDYGMAKPDTRYFLLSETEKLYHARQRTTLPEINSKNNVYDNGDTQLYHRVPQTPYQR